MGRTLYAYGDKLWEVSQRFEPTNGARQFTLQPGEYLFMCYGGKGGERGSSRQHDCIPCWNYGAAAYGIFITDQEETMYAMVGGNGNDYDYPTNPNAGLGGFNGGGNGGTSSNGTDVTGAGGGGASDIRLTLDSTMITEPQRADVPSEYIELEYMEKRWGVDGCFNSGYKMNPNTRMEFKMWVQGRSVQYTTNDYMCLLGQRSGQNSADQFILEPKFGGVIGAAVVGPGTLTPFTPANRFDQIPFDCTFDLTVTPTRVSWTDFFGVSGSIENIPFTTTSARDLYIFCYLNNTSPFYDGSVGMRVYTFKIYENDELLHDFVPVKRVSDNALGFYDTVAGEFRGIIGTLYGKSKEARSLTLLSRILVAAGGGGNAVFSRYSKTGYTYGGGTYGSAIIGSEASTYYKQPDSGIQASQNDGYAFGQGMNGIKKASTGSYGNEGAGGGGGGWFGGYSPSFSVAYSDIPGSGGSSYALTSDSWKPYGYVPTSHYHLTHTALVPCQSEEGLILICTQVNTLLAEDKIIVPFQGASTKIKLYTGTYDIKCWGGEGKEFLEGNRYPTRFYGGYSEGRLELNNPQNLYAVVGGSGLFYGSGGGMIEPYRYNEYAGYNGGGKSTKTAASNNITYEEVMGGGATDVRLTMDDTPVAENAPSRSLMSRIIVAGGGGSIGYSNGGKGGGTSGERTASAQGVTGGPGTQTESPTVTNHPECNGGFGYGGPGHTYGQGRGGSGGGGWFGGSGSHSNGRTSNDIMGGNGGSGYVLTEDSYKPEYYIPTSEFYMTNASTVVGGNTLIPNMTKIEIDVIQAFCNKLLMYDMDGYKTYDENQNKWVVFSQTINPSLIEEYGRYDIPNINGMLDEFQVVADDPVNALSNIEVSSVPLPQSIVFLVPRRYSIGHSIIDAVYDTSIYDFSTNVSIYDDQYNAYTVTIDKTQESDEVLKLYSIMLFSQ